MTRRFARFILPWAIFVLIAVLLVIAWTAYNRVSPSETARSASSAPRGAAEHVGGIPVSSPPFLGAPTVHDSPAGLAAGARRASDPDDAGAPPHTAAMGWAPRRLSAGLSDRTATPSPLGARPSSVALDVGSFALPTPLVGFGKLRPIQESWYVGVASGIASHMGAGYPSWYLALPIGKGYRVRISGPAASVVMVSTDAGPALWRQRPPYNRVADLSLPVFVKVCGVPASFGLCPVDISVEGRG